MTNEFNTILTDRILSKTILGTIQIDSPVNFTQAVNFPAISEPIINVDTIEPYTLGGNISLSTPNVIISNNLRTTSITGNGSDILITTPNLTISDNLKTNFISNDGLDITVNSNLLFPSDKAINISAINNAGLGTIDLNGNVQIPTPYQLRYGNTLESILQESTSVTKITNPDTTTYKITSIDNYAGGSTADMGSARTCLLNVNYYTMPFNSGFYTNVFNNNFTISFPSPNYLQVTYNNPNVTQRLLFLEFNTSFFQNIGGSPDVTFGIAVNPVINVVSGQLTGIPHLESITRQRFTGVTQTFQNTCRYIGHVSNGDSFVLVCRHSSNASVITNNYTTVSAFTRSIGSD